MDNGAAEIKNYSVPIAEHHRDRGDNLYIDPQAVTFFNPWFRSVAIFFDFPEEFTSLVHPRFAATVMI
jgi:hypothetical protein